MEPPHVDGKLRYHLGQVTMLEQMAQNIQAGGRSCAVICDPPVIVSSRARPEAKEQRDTIHSFLRNVGPSGLEIYLLSQLSADLRQKDELKYQEIEAQVLVSFTEFNSVASKLGLSQQAIEDLASYRSGGQPEISFSLKPLLGTLQKNFGGEDAELLTTLYAFTNRASWFEGHHIAATAATLSIMGVFDEGSPVILEAKRNAYPWLVQKALFDHAAQRKKVADAHWPQLELCESVPGLDGSSFMRLAERESCLFLDQSYLDHITSIAGISEEFEETFGERFPHLMEGAVPGEKIGSLLAEYRSSARRGSLLLNLNPTDPEDSDEVSLILGGGGAKGLALIGAIEGIWDKYQFEHFWGTSAGSIVAVLLGAGYTPVELEGVLKVTPFESFLDSGVLRLSWNVLTHGALHRANEFEPWLDNLLKAKLGLTTSPKMKDLPHRTTIFATQADKGTVRFESEGENWDTPASFAVRSSIAYPFFFKPGTLYGKPAYDGGVANNFPLKEFKLAHPNGAYIGVALRSQTENAPTGITWPFARAFRDIFDIWSTQDEGEIIQNHKGNIIVVDTQPIGTFDIALNDAGKNFLLAIGKAQASKFLYSRGLVSESRWQSDRDTANALCEILEQPIGEIDSD